MYLYEVPDRRTVMLTTGLFVAFGTIISAGDLAALPADDIVPYALGRGTCLLVLLGYFVAAYLGYAPPHVALVVYGVSIAYAIHGQLFRPDYWLIPIQVNVLYPLFYFVRFGWLVGMFATSMLLIDGVFLVTAERYVAAGVYSHEHVINCVIATVIINGIVLLAYRNLIVLRLRKTQLFQRFFDLGKNFEYVMHDLKSMLSAPIVQASLIEAGDRDAVHALKQDMSTIKHYVARTNELLYSNLEDPPVHQWVRIRDSVDLVSTLIRSRLKSIEIECHGELEVEAPPEVIHRILINAMINSVEAIMRRKHEHGRISVISDASGLVVRDNSGVSLAPNVLRKLNSPSETFTERVATGGLGTLIIRDLVRSLGGSCVYSNGDTGVALTLTFPERIVRGAPAADRRG